MTTSSPKIEAKILAKLDELTQDYEGWSAGFFKSSETPTQYLYESDLILRRTQEKFVLLAFWSEVEIWKLPSEPLHKIFTKLDRLRSEAAVERILALTK